MTVIRPYSQVRDRVVPGALWRHRRKPGLTKEVAGVTSTGKVLGPGTSKSGHSLSVTTLLRDYEFIGTREPGGS